MGIEAQKTLDREIGLLRERLESAEEMRRAIVAEELDGFVVGSEHERVVLLEGSAGAGRALLERLPQCVVTVARSGEVLYANERFAALVGRPLAQLFFTPITDLLAPEERDRFRCSMRSGHVERVLEILMQHADGHSIPVRASFAAESGDHWTLLITDAAAARRTEDAECALQAIHHGEIDGVVVGGDQVVLVEDAHRPYRNILDQVKEGVVTISSSGEVLYANEHFAAMIGRRYEQLLGTPLGELLGTPLGELLGGAADRQLSGADRDPTPVQAALTRRDGTRVSVSISCRSVQRGDALTLIVTDLSERERVREIEERAHRNDQFLAVLAHELRNPLGAIRNAVQFLDRSPALPVNERSALGVITRQSETLTRLVDDLLDVHRLNNGTIVLRRRPVDLCLVVQEAVRAARATLSGRHQQIDLQLCEQPLYAQVDEVRIAQVLGNLLLNAAKFTPQGGQIRVNARPSTGTAAAAVALIEVADNGIGMAPDLLARVFEPYVQGHKPEDAPDGLGLGLSVARRLIQLHEGSINARSDGPGAGSIFTIALPLCGAPAVAAQVTQREERRTSDVRILVADDDSDSAGMLAALLELLGHRTYKARDGQEAIALAEEVQPDVAILDIGMPRLDGYGAARALRARNTGKRLLLYALTGWGQPEDRVRAKQAGFDAHFVKPVDIDQLSRTLHKHLGESRSADPS